MTRLLLERPEPEDNMLPENLVYNYPNPTEGDITTIRYRLEKSANVWIQIFDLAGEKITEFAGPGDGQTENEVNWGLHDVESGVYFCRVTATRDGDEKSVTFKIAVVK
jgi:hypothetical protein